MILTAIDICDIFFVSAQNIYLCINFQVTPGVWYLNESKEWVLDRVDYLMKKPASYATCIKQ